MKFFNLIAILMLSSVLSTHAAGTLKLHSHIKGTVTIDGKQEIHAVVGDIISIDNLSEGAHALKIGDNFSSNFYIGSDAGITLDSLFITTSIESIFSHILIGKNKKALNLLEASQKHRGFNSPNNSYTELEKIVISLLSPRTLAMQGLDKYIGSEKTVSLQLKNKNKSRYKIIEVTGELVKAEKIIKKVTKKVSFTAKSFSLKDIYKLLPKTDVGYILKATLKNKVSKTKSAQALLEKVSLTLGETNFPDLYSYLIKNGVKHPEYLHSNNYTVNHSKTPEQYKKILINVGRWMKKQRLQTLVKKIFVKKLNDGKIALYIQVKQKFFKNKKSDRLGIVEGVWRLWHSQLTNSGMSSGRHKIHLVLLNEHNKIVGGSRFNDSEDFWSSKK